MQRKAVWRETRPFHPRAGDVIHPVLWLVKGRAIARLHARGLCLFFIINLTATTFGVAKFDRRTGGSVP